MTAGDLYAALRAAGLTVAEYEGWETRGGSWADGSPVGLLHHHTAPPVPYPVDNLAGADQGRIKANANTKPDGTVWLLAYRASNYSAGSGMGQVLDEVRAGTPPEANAKDRGWNPDGSDDDTNGNPWFWCVENDHPGDGSPMPDVQSEAIARATQVFLAHFGLTVGNVLSHAEWTARKGDPYWNGDRRVIETIRSEVAALEEDEMPLSDEDVQRVADAVLNREYPDPSDPTGERRRSIANFIGQGYGLDVRAVRASEAVAGALPDDQRSAPADVPPTD